jgi:hypothetical protein
MARVVVMSVRRHRLPVWFRLGVSALLWAGALGCASTQVVLPTRLPQDQLPADKALVYFLRFDMYLYPDTAWLLEGETLIAALTSASYVAAYFDPGAHWLWTWKTRDSPDDYQRGLFFFEAGKTYCVRFEGSGPYAGSERQTRGDALTPMTPQAISSFTKRYPGIKRKPVTPELQETARATVHGRVAASGLPPQFPPGLPEEARPESALVYLFSPQSWARPRWVLEDQRPIAWLRGSGYAFAEFAEGLHRLWNFDPDRRYVGEEYFVFEAGDSYTILVDDQGTMMTLPTDAELMQLAANPRFGLSTPTAAEEEKARQAALEHAAVAGPAELPPCEPPLISAGEARLAAGTPIPLRAKENATSFNTPLGERLRFEVAEDVRVGNTIVVPRGLPVEGVVSEVKPASKGEVGGVLAVEIRRLDLPDGRKVSLLGLLPSMGSPSPTQETLLSIMVGGTNPSASLGSPAAAGAGLFIALMAALISTTVTGGEAWLLAGMPATAPVRCDTAVVEASLRAPEKSEPPPAGGVVPATSAAQIEIPLSGRVTGSWCVGLEMNAPPAEIWIGSVGGRPPPERIGPSKTTSIDRHQRVCFPAWAVVRLAALDPRHPVKTTVVLEGTLSDGAHFFAPTKVFLAFAEP